MPPLPPLVVPRMSALGALLALLAPGLGHWWIGRARRGLLLFVAAASGANLAAIAVLFDPADAMSRKLYFGLPLLLGAWLASVIDGWRLAWFVRRRATRARRQAELDAGVRALAEEDWKAARSAFARAAADDECDPAASLGLARAEFAAGRFAAAYDHARRALRATGGGRYRDALRTEAAAARAALRRG